VNEVKVGYSQACDVNAAILDLRVIEIICTKCVSDTLHSTPSCAWDISLPRGAPGGNFGRVAPAGQVAGFPFSPHDLQSLH